MAALAVDQEAEICGPHYFLDPPHPRPLSLPMCCLPGPAYRLSRHRTLSMTPTLSSVQKGMLDPQNLQKLQALWSLVRHNCPLERVMRSLSFSLAQESSARRPSSKAEQSQQDPDQGPAQPNSLHQPHRFSIINLVHDAIDPSNAR